MDGETNGSGGIATKLVSSAFALGLAATLLGAAACSAAVPSDGTPAPFRTNKAPCSEAGGQDGIARRRAFADGRRRMRCRRNGNNPAERAEKAPPQVDSEGRHGSGRLYKSKSGRNGP